MLWGIFMWLHFKQQMIKLFQEMGLLPQPQMRVIPIRVRSRTRPRRPY